MKEQPHNFKWICSGCGRKESLKYPGPYAFSIGKSKIGVCPLCMKEVEKRYQERLPSVVTVRMA